MDNRTGKFPENIDQLDIRILRLLQQDATLPVAEVAERVASSKSVVWRRIQRLVEDGVIRERVAVLDPHRLGFGVMVFARVKMSRHDKHVLPRFVDAVRAFPQVVECHTLMGDVDFLLKVIVRDVEEYEHFFWQELSRIDGVQEVSSSIAMSSFINRTQLPLGE